MNTRTLARNKLEAAQDLINDAMEDIDKMLPPHDAPSELGLSWVMWSLHCDIKRAIRELDEWQEEEE